MDRLNEEAMVSTPEQEALIEQAIAHVNAGELEEGRALLEQVLEQDPMNDRAWVWLSGCVEGEMQRRICLQQALRANPNNQAALDGMQLLDGELVQAAEAPPTLLESRLSAIGMGDEVTATLDREELEVALRSKLLPQRPRRNRRRPSRQRPPILLRSRLKRLVKNRGEGA